MEGCRQRHTPPSVRFLGRHVYLSVMVVLLAAMTHGVSERRARYLCLVFGVPLATLLRWRTWWQTTFAASECRQSHGAAAGLVADDLPRSLLVSLRAEGGLRQRLIERVKLLLLLLRPLTTSTWDARSAMGS